MKSGPRLALLGAFPFPSRQGSQIFMREQARALAACGARPELLTYGRGVGPHPEDLVVHRTAQWISPRSMRSGPQWGKPLVDLALARTWQQTAARARAQGDSFTCLLAHNAEAAGIGLALRRLTGVPVVYVVHTILRHELSAYWPRAAEPFANRVGHWLDRALVARCDGLIALGQDAALELERHANALVLVQPPGHLEAPAPTAEAIAIACKRHALMPNDYALYSGNLDRYQDLELLEESVRRAKAPLPTIVVASHDATAVARFSKAGRTSVRCVAVPAFEDMRALIHGAQSLLLTRRRPGGFPIKLLNYMEAARPIVAFEGIAPGLVDGESARLLPPDADGSEIARALAELRAEPELRRRLGDGALDTLRREHDWMRIGSRTLKYLDPILAGGASPS
ncbi:MAG: glycosyltransferase family 4 protein [Myxococcota bacterium]